MIWMKKKISQMHRMLTRQGRATHKSVLNEMSKLVQTRRSLGGQRRYKWIQTLPVKGKPGLGLSCYFERHLYFDCLSFEFSIFHLGDADREIIHVSSSFSNLMDQMRMIHNLEGLGVGCKQERLHDKSRAKGYLERIN
jgi:hypothetical protein